MDDRYAYVLNTLWTKHFDLGRVVRFRHVTRGRQAEVFEILTAEQQEYAAYLFPATFDAGQLTQLARTMTLLGQQRFPVSAMLPSRTGQWMVAGPQGASMMVSESPVGQYLLPDQWSEQDISQLGLRLGWMHRLLTEHVPLPRNPSPPGVMPELAAALAAPAESLPGKLPKLDSRHVEQLTRRLREEPAPVAWVHGDMQPAAVLLDHDHQIRSVVDWGLMHPGEPMEDVVDAFVHWCVAADGQVDAARGRILLESYRSLRQGQMAAWGRTVDLWCARRIIDAQAGRRVLPRGFATFLGDPTVLVKPLTFCDSKAA